MLLRLLFILLMVSQLSAQKKDFDIEGNLQKARAIVSEKPDSAKIYLDQIEENLPYLKANDSLVVEFFNNYGVYYIQVSKIDSAKYFFNKAIEKSTSNKRKASLYLNLANAYRIVSEYETSLKYLGMAIRFAESSNDKLALSSAYGEKGSNYAYMLENETATKYFLKGLEIIKNENEPHREAILKQKLANLYFKMHNFEFAKELYEDCLKVLKEYKDYRNYYLTLVNYADCLIQMDKTEDAKGVLKEAIEGIKPFKSPEILAIAYGKLAKTYLAGGDVPTTVKYYKTAYNTISQITSFRSLRIAAEYILVLNGTGNHKEALKIIKEVNALPNWDVFNIEDQMTFYEVAAVTYEEEGLKDLTIETLKSVIELKEVIHKTEYENAAKEIQAKFQVESQRETNKILEVKNDVLNEQVVAQRRIQILGFLLLFILLITAVSFIVIYFLKNRLQKSKLEEAERTRLNAEKSRKEEIERAERQQHTLRVREQELTSMTLQLANLQEEIAAVMKNTELSKPDEIKKSLYKIIKKQDYWKEFTLKFTQIHPEYVENLQRQFPILTKNDIEYISLLKLNLSNKEIATLLRISHESVISKKYRIKKKLNIEDDGEFNQRVLQLN
ncbi:MAG TPA: tetratricopeptide repeat protein [Flavobacterium sp.]|nr:tetratricopeptide repeat protein [Flavobacterium sp.]